MKESGLNISQSEDRFNGHEKLVWLQNLLLLTLAGQEQKQTN